MNHLKTGNAFYGQGSYKNYKFLGKELQETGFYDMGARFYMPDLGKFGQHDPLSAATLDPYGYAYNNPIFFSDPTGLFGTQANKKEEIPANSAGGENSPIQIDEVVITPQMKSVVSKTRSTIPSNCLVCNIGGGIIAPRIILNIPEIKRSYYNFNPYRSDNTPEWYGFGGRANWGLGTAAASLDNFSGSTRVTTTGSSIKIYRRNSKGNVFIKNKYVKTMGISKIGASIGTASFFLGVAFDGLGVINYINNPTSPNAVDPRKATLNTVMGYVGWRGGGYGAAISTLYFGVDNFYPGGWIGASETAAMTEAHEQQMTGHPFFSNSAIKY